MSDVRHYVGSRRVVDVMDCATQRNSFMTMKDFEDYFIGGDRKKQLNVIRYSCASISFEKIFTKNLRLKIFQ